MENSNTITLDPERQKQAKDYARVRRRLMLVDLAQGTAYLLAWLFTGWSAALRNAVSNLASNELLIVAGYGLLFGAVYTIISLPLSYYEGFILPHRYGQSNETLKGWIADQLKGLLLGALLSGLLLIR